MSLVSAAGWEGTMVEPDLTGRTQIDDDRIERFRALYDPNHDAILSYCRRRTDAASAEDAVSEIFLTAWRRLDEIPADAARLWLYGTARKVIGNQRRSTNRRDRLTVRLADSPLSRRVAPAAEDSSTAGVRVALASLAPDDQEILRLLAWEGLSLSETAVVLGCSTNAATIRAHRARKRLGIALDTPTTHSPTREQNETKDLSK